MVLIGKRLQLTFLFLLIFFLGITVGGYLFSSSQPRSFLAVHQCQNRCLNPNELAGLIGSAGIQKLPHIIPVIVFETDKTVVIESPIKQARTHYVVLPKRDIRDASDLTNDDKEYLADAYAVLGKMIREKKLEKYKITTNGRGYQHVTYLHFHLLSQ